MGTFEAPNDYRNYLMHYGVKGMKWRNHRRSQMNKNFQLPERRRNPLTDDREEFERQRGSITSEENVRRRQGRTNITSSEYAHNVQPTRQRGSNTAEDAIEEQRAYRRNHANRASNHALSWQNTHTAHPGNMPSVIGHIPRSAHRPENYAAATENLNKKRKKRG